MKVLYVEDELKLMCDRAVLPLFESLLTKKQLRRLERLRSEDEFDSADLRDFFNNDKSIPIDVAITFPEALDYVLNRTDEYALFIVDRNLSGKSGDDYYERVVELKPDYSEELYCRFEEREGDYLLEVLCINKEVDCKKRFFMLTGNNDELRVGDSVKTLISHNKFEEKNIIDKTNDEGIRRLKSIVDSRGEIMARIRYPELFRLEKHSEIRSGFTTAMLGLSLAVIKRPDMSREDIRARIAPLRTSLMELLKDVNNMEEMRYCTPPSDRGERFMVDQLRTSRLGFIHPYALLIYNTACETSAHPFEDKNFPTLNTLRAMMSAMGDICLWLDLAISATKERGGRSSKS